MPTPQLKTLASKHGLSLSVVERYWRECKQGKAPKTAAEWAGVYLCTKNKCKKYGRKKAPR